MKEIWSPQPYICVNLSAACTVDSTATIARILPIQPKIWLRNSQFLLCTRTHANA